MKEIVTKKKIPVIHLRKFFLLKASGNTCQNIELEETLKTQKKH